MCSNGLHVTIVLHGGFPVHASAAACRPSCGYERNRALASVVPLHASDFERSS
jgi:hypothetical protein